jgi:hypothetical protein
MPIPSTLFLSLNQHPISCGSLLDNIGTDQAAHVNQTKHVSLSPSKYCPINVTITTRYDTPVIGWRHSLQLPQLQIPAHFELLLAIEGDKMRSTNKRAAKTQSKSQRVNLMEEVTGEERHFSW